MFHYNIRKLIKDDKFVKSMKCLEWHAWTLFDNEGENFLVNPRRQKLQGVCEKVLKILLDIGASTSIKVYFYIAIWINLFIKWFDKNTCWSWYIQLSYF